MEDDHTDPCKELKRRVNELKRLNDELLEMQHQETVLDYAWSGNLGHWYFNLEMNTVVFDQLKVTTLGYEASEIPESVPYQFFTEKVHPDDYWAMMQSMRDHIANIKPVYECSYRIQTKSGSYKWFYDRGKITQWDTDGKPVLIVGIVFDITESKQKELSLEEENAHLRLEATTDSLTGLPNKQAALKSLRNRMELSKAQDQPLSICMFDIDHFKRINDSKGHLYGDYVLQKVANVFKTESRGLDVVGRYGGEEFIAIFYGADHQQSVLIADRMRRHIEQLELADSVCVTISGGVARYLNQNVENLIEEADKLLYVAKSQGRNRIVGQAVQGVS
jgi:diguanylate cyclase (GGDEF)-like protein/PAS domain S-box-containing protein